MLVPTGDEFAQTSSNQGRTGESCDPDTRKVSFHHGLLELVNVIDVSE